MPFAWSFLGLTGLGRDRGFRCASPFSRGFLRLTRLNRDRGVCRARSFCRDILGGTGLDNGRGIFQARAHHLLENRGRLDTSALQSGWWLQAWWRLYDICRKFLRLASLISFALRKIRAAQLFLC